MKRSIATRPKRSARGFYTKLGMKSTKSGEMRLSPSRQTSLRSTRITHEIREYKHPNKTTRATVSRAINTFPEPSRSVAKRAMRPEGSGDRRLLVARDRRGHIQGIGQVNLDKHEAFVEVLAARKQGRGTGTQIMAYVAKKY